MASAATQLGWNHSPGFVPAERIDTLPAGALRYACRKAVDSAGLEGVFLIRDQEGRNQVPLVFHCRANSESHAREIHRRIWNLNLVPFLVVETATRLRVYQGFKYDILAPDHLPLVEASLSDTAEILENLSAFRAESLDSGAIFERWSSHITPQTRVDEHLLVQLQKLDGLLRKKGLPREASHSLIGKYVWLSYLRARGILSPWRMAKFGIVENDVFSRAAKLTSFHHLSDQLQEWLNGEIFPLRGEDRRDVKSEHLQLVAGVFAGDTADGQLCLFTDYYDFSHLPIETLSVVYEQFLHHKEEGGTKSEGEESGAYYTPVCLADYMISEMDRKIPLREGVAVFDPSCGSGAFLVQAFRRLVEHTMAERGKDLSLVELRTLLVKHIFGVDRDPDACRVACMSLAIALLDYAKPPDVSGPSSSFKLPTLLGDNIRQSDFFDLDPIWPRGPEGQPPQWIIGNPPWVELKSSQRKGDKRNAPAWNWLEQNNARKAAALPVSGNQVAEMFVWRVLDFAGSDSAIGLVLPGMTLFKQEARKFRQQIFTRLGVWQVANFANLAYVLFAGRVDVPAMCLFYAPQPSDSTDPLVSIAPLVAEQTANRPASAGRQMHTWNILVRAQDYREIDRKEATKGDRLTWKLAMWGSERDLRLMRRMQRFPTLNAWCEQNSMVVSQGPEIKSNAGHLYPLDKSLVGMRRVTFNSSRQVGPLFSIPSSQFSKPLQQDDCYIRRAGGIEVCSAPHILVHKGRNFAIFSEEPFIVAPREIGIHGPDETYLKALALYIISPAAKWHQFQHSTEWGIATSIATLTDLKALPIPLPSADNTAIRELATIYDSLAADAQAFAHRQEELLAQAYAITDSLLGLRPHERDIISGFFAGSYKCTKGKFPEDAVGHANHSDFQSYLKTLQRELDDYTATRSVRHQITITPGRRHAVITIKGFRAAKALPLVIQPLDESSRPLLDRLTAALTVQHSQWMYFEKSLCIYEKGQLHFLKPMRRLEWNVRQAVLDADHIIAETLSAPDPATKV